MPRFQVVVPTPLFKPFTYESDEDLAIGQLVIVPLRSSFVVGMIGAIESDFKGTVRDIDLVLPWHLNKNQITFLKWMSDYTMTPFGLCVKLMIPFPFKEIQKMLKTKRLEDKDKFSFIKTSSITLTSDQKQASLHIQKKIGTFTPFLLDGITGSGKTEVYFDVIRKILEKGQQALVLLPEITLTTQWLERFQEQFGFKPYLWHSHVNTKQKREIYLSVYRGDSCVVVGARSALFLPFQKLGFIVVDEEHDTSYKQEEQLIYNARDAAVQRAKIEECPIVLASATPSLETYHNGQTGRYTVLKLQSRYGVNELPQINVIDKRLKEEKIKGKFLSKTLVQKIEENLQKKEQTLLFINRRGFAPLTLCSDCGYRFQCKGCSAWLVHHEKKNILKCHHCNHEEGYPSFCPECGTKESLVPCGPGVERLNEEIEKSFPKARILVVSSDMLTSKTIMESVIHDILSEDVDIIIGTQLMAKGHHFPKLTLIGIVDSDMGLSGMDLRAAEKTFQLLYQVAGRAGREHLKGEIYLQTYNPEHPLIKALMAYDLEGFFKAELGQREIFHMPPFSKLLTITLQSPHKNDLEKAAYHLSKSAPTDENFQILGPTPPPFSILRGMHRERFLVIAEKSVQRQKIISAWVFKTKLPKSVRVMIDVDPVSFL